MSTSENRVPRRRRALVVASTALAGLAAAWLLALCFGTGLKNATILSLLSGGSAILAGLAGFGALQWGRTKPLGLQLVIVALTGVVAVSAGTFAAGRAMFLTSSSAKDMIVILIAAGTVGVLVAFVLAQHIVESVRTLVTKTGELESIPDIVAASRAMPNKSPADGPEATKVVEIRTRELDGLRIRIDDVAKQLAESESKRRALETSRRELVAWVSHDLRTPLAGLRALAEALEDGLAGDAETVERYHHMILREVDELSRRVDDLFELSRIQAGALNLRIEPASLDDLVSDALAMATPVAEAKGVRISGSMMSKLGSVELSTPEFLRVLSNILDNAIRHTPPEGEIRVEAGSSDGHAFVSVRDSCGGIPENEIDRVFEMAFRGDASRARNNGDGAGLGLAIAQGLITAHHGAIDVCNDGDGCCFTVKVPLKSIA